MAIPHHVGLSRRRLLFSLAGVATVATAAAVGIELDALPGRSWAYGRLGLDGADGAIPDLEPGEQVSGEFESAARLGARCGWTIAYPPGAARDLPVVIVLHGRGADHTTAFTATGFGLDRFLAQAVSQGVPPFALASVDGGDTYWHLRNTGEDAGAMVVDEFLPLLADQGLDVTRIAFFGWSMGGYGALSLAGRLGPDRVAAAGALSPALWEEYADTAPGAFDNAADFEEATLFGRQRELDRIKLRIDCGEGDPFYAATKNYRSSFNATPEGGLERGDHDYGYWRRMAPTQLEFLGNAVTG